MKLQISFAIFVACFVAIGFIHNSSVGTSSVTSLSSTSSYPNIVMIVLDDVGMNDLGYLSTDLTECTPYIDSLAAAGVKLTNFYAQEVCTPSRGSLMTGKYPIHIGLQHWQIEAAQPWGLPVEENILPQTMKAKGYTTHMIGKWHLGHYSDSVLPQNRGFDTFYGFYSGGEDYFTHVSLDSCDSTYHDEETCYTDFSSNAGVEKDIDETYGPILFAEKAKEVFLNNDPSVPLFLYLSLPNCHAPLTVSDEQLSNHADIVGKIPNDFRRTFATIALEMDTAVETVIESLKDADLYENSIIIVMSDNGGAVDFAGSNFPYRGTKKYFYEGGIKVPAFIHSPLFDESVAGTEYSGLMHISDIFTTLVSGVLGESSPKVSGEYTSLDGVNQWDAINGNIANGYPRTEMLINIDNLDSAGNDKGYYTAAIRSNDWKLMYNQQIVTWYEVPTDQSTIFSIYTGDDLFSGLYDLKNDPYETTDVKEDYPEVYEALLSKILDQYLPTMVDYEYKSVDERAFSLWDQTGYVQPWLDG